MNLGAHVPDVHLLPFLVAPGSILASLGWNRLGSRWNLPAHTHINTHAHARSHASTGININTQALARRDAQMNQTMNLHLVVCALGFGHSTGLDGDIKVLYFYLRPVKGIEVTVLTEPVHCCHLYSFLLVCFPLP